MTFDLPVLNRIAPSMKRAVAISVVALVCAALILFFGVLPKRKAILAINEDIQTLNARINQMRADIDNAERQNQATAKVAAERDALAASGVIEPLLGSFAMRGKTLLDPVAQQTGFHLESVRELQPIALQLPKHVPEQRHCRQPVEFTGQGSYTQILAFVAQTEATQPLAALTGLLVLGQPQNPEVHRAVITFEWPAKGEKVKPADPAPKKK